MSRNFWSTDNPCHGVAILLEQCGGDVDQVIITLSGFSCSRDSARQMSVKFAPCLGITEVEFMRRWRAVFMDRQKRRV